LEWLESEGASKFPFIENFDRFLKRARQTLKGLTNLCPEDIELRGVPRMGATEWDEFYNWEAARDIPTIRRHVAKLRSQCKTSSFEALVDGMKHKLFGVRRSFSNPPRSLEQLFYFCPEWPDRAFLKAMSGGERRRRIDALWPPVDEATFLRESLQRDNREFLARRIAMQPECQSAAQFLHLAERPYVEESDDSALALFRLNWQFSVPALVSAIRTWLEAHHPNPQAASRRGQGRSTESKRSVQVRQLFAWRLLDKHRLSWTLARLYTQFHSGKPLYKDKCDWFKAKKEADKRLDRLSWFVRGGEHASANEALQTLVALLRDEPPMPPLDFLRREQRAAQE
jgi:hypothetical protein